MKRSALIIMTILTVFLLAGCTADQTGLAGSWKADIPSEQDLKLGAASGKGEIRSVVYHLSEPDWFHEGDLAAAYEFQDPSEQAWYDAGFYSVKGNRIDLMGSGSYTIAGGVLTIRYDDGTVRTFTKVQSD